MLPRANTVSRCSPERCWIHCGNGLPKAVEELDPADSIPFEALFDTYPLMLAPTQFSATAPLKMAAKRHAFRAATMGGFCEAMIPALRIDYGDTSFLLTGDMENTAETDLVNSGANLKADVLQVGHHGSSTSTGYLFLNAVLPEMGVISCGAGNKYGHPHEETLSILRDAKVDVYRTDLQGTITIGSDGQNFTVGTEHFVPDSQLNPTDPSASSTAQQAYIGNVNSKKFHLPTCANLPAEKNQVLFSSYDEAIAAGYTPCASCIK